MGISYTGNLIVWFLILGLIFHKLYFYIISGEGF